MTQKENAPKVHPDAQTQLAEDAHARIVARFLDKGPDAEWTWETLAGEIDVRGERRASVFARTARSVFPIVNGAWSKTPGADSAASNPRRPKVADVLSIARFARSYGSE